MGGLAALRGGPIFQAMHMDTIIRILAVAVLGPMLLQGFKALQGWIDRRREAAAIARLPRPAWSPESRRLN